MQKTVRFSSQEGHLAQMFPPIFGKGAAITKTKEYACALMLRLFVIMST